MTPDELLRHHPRQTLRWLRRRLGMSRPDLARSLRSTTETVSAWEERGTTLAPLDRDRIAALLAPHLATSAGAAVARARAPADESKEMEEEQP